MGSNGPHFELIYHDDTVYEGWIGSRFILMHNRVLIITEYCIRDNEQGIWIGLID